MTFPTFVLNIFRFSNIKYRQPLSMARYRDTHMNDQKIYNVKRQDKRRSFSQNIKGACAVFGVFLMVFAALSASTAIVNAANLVPDASFENGTANWVSGDSLSSIDSTVARSGSKSLKLTNDASATNHNAGQYRIGGIQAGVEYAYTVWVRGNNVTGAGAGGKPLAVIRWRNNAGVRLLTERYLWAPYGTYNWSPLKINLQAPPGAAEVDISFRSWQNCLTGTTNWDDVILEPRDISYRGNSEGTYQAESASNNFGGTIESTETNYTGSGYVETTTDGAYLQWNNVSGGTTGGTRILSFRYAQEGNPKNWEIFVNSESQGIVQPLTTGRMNSWASSDWEVDLQPGNNTVRLRISQVTAGPLIDKLDVYQLSTVTPTAATPTITPNGGSFTGSQVVTLATTTPGATIFYTTDGSTPTTGSTSYTATGPFTLNASATVRAFAVATGHLDSAAASATFTGTSGGQPAYPNGLPWMVPGTIEAEDYDTGGQGIAYNDQTAGNKGLQYRTDDVDIWYSNNPPEGYYTGGNGTGEWLTYTVDVATTGQYQLDLRVATPRADGRCGWT